MSQAVKLAIVEELKDRIRISLEFRKKYDEARTPFKKTFYMKKLKENNELAAKLLVALNRVNLGEKDVPIPAGGVIAESQSLQPAIEATFTT